MIIFFIIKQVGYDVKGMKRRDGEGGRGGSVSVVLHYTIRQQKWK